MPGPGQFINSPVQKEFSMITPTEALAEAASQATAAAAVQTAVINSNALIVNGFGYSLNLGSLMIVLAIIGIVVTFWRIQKSQRLDFADMLTKDGRKVSSTKVLQLIGGIAGTWVIIKTGAAGTLSFEIFATYLTYVASIEGFSKFISAKYNYDEVSVRDAKKISRVPKDTMAEGMFDNLADEIELANEQAQTAEKFANSAVKTSRKAQNTLKKGT